MHNTKEYLHTFKAGLREQSRASIVLFIAIVLFSRIKSFLRNLCSRSSKNSSSVSKLDPWFLILETQFSKLEPRNSILDSRKLWGSRIEFRVKTVNLPLSSTVPKSGKCKSSHANIIIIISVRNGACIKRNNHQVPSKQHNSHGAFHITTKSLDFVGGHKATHSKKCQSKKLFSFNKFCFKVVFFINFRFSQLKHIRYCSLNPMKARSSLNQANVSSHWARAYSISPLDGY